MMMMMMMMRMMMMRRMMMMHDDDDDDDLKTIIHSICVSPLKIIQLEHLQYTE